jgi:hypothetical protein
MLLIPARTANAKTIMRRAGACDTFVPPRGGDGATRVAQSIYAQPAEYDLEHVRCRVSRRIHAEFTRGVRRDERDEPTPLLLAPGPFPDVRVCFYFFFGSSAGSTVSRTALVLFSR